MLRTFKVKEGEHYFKGFKFQELMYPALMLIITFFLFISSLVEIKFIIGGLICSFLLYAFSLWKLSDIELEARFDSSCIYTLEDNFDQINKLYGVSEGFHHANSARLGWRCVNGKDIEILAYTYVNGDRESKTLMNCVDGEWLKLSLYLKKEEYVFIGENEDGEKAKISMPRKRGFFFGKLFTYKLFPYFGGKVSAPQDMHIDIVEKEK